MSVPANTPDARWTDPQRIAALRKWHPAWVKFAAPLNDLIVRALAPAEGLRILDLACGAGEPAFSLAAAVGPSGHVTATDLGLDLLAMVEEDASARGITNLECKTVDAQFLPFPKESFDAVTCRFGVMFFPSCERALPECHRVLVPGGKAVFLVWGKYEQPFWLATIEILGGYVNLPEIPPDAPHVFRFSEAGKLARAMREAGFTSVQEERVSRTLTWPGDPRNLWTYFSESSGMYRQFMQQLSKDDWESGAREVEKLLAEYFDGQQLKLPVEVILATGMRA
jgi:ubiquinone/menaquinone biosynthesis C-methylase UbiE